MHNHTSQQSEAQPQAAPQVEGGLKGGGGSGQGDCGAADPSARTLPTSIAGYQHLTCGVLKNDDIMVLFGVPYSYVPDDFVGLKVEECRIMSGMAVYRKMACAKQGDCDSTGWQEKQFELRSRAADLSQFNHPDKAKTYDEGKPPLAYLPWAGVDEVAMVQAYGHAKYKDYNNYRKGMEVGRNLSCAIRHIRAFMEGEDLDKESGRSHLAHAACRLLFVLQNIHDGTAIDDRFKKGTK